MGKRDINTDKEGKTLLYIMAQRTNFVLIFLGLPPESEKNTIKA